MDDYFKVIDGIKYDVNQSIAICEGQNSWRDGCYRESRKTRFFRTITYIKTRNYFTDKRTVRKGINGNYFLDMITYYQEEETDEIKHIRRLVGDQKFYMRDIRPITRDEAVEIYFNGYQCKGDWFHYTIGMNQLLGENEAFEGVPVA
jgi:hypothetical protein